MANGVSTIVASVLLVLVVISLGAAFLLFSSSAFTQLGQSGTKSQQQLTKQTVLSFSVEAIGENKVTIRNRGSTTLDTSSLSFYIDEQPPNHTDVTINAGAIGTVNITNLWAFGPGFHNLRVTGGSISDSERFESIPSSGRVLDLRFEESTGSTPGDSSGNVNNGAFSGTLRADFEGTVDGGFDINCNPPVNAYVTGVVGQGLKLWSTTTGAACLYKPQLFGVNPGYTIWFYAKGYVSGGVYNSGGWYSYVQDAESGCRTPNGLVEIYDHCNGGNAYADWRLFKLVAYANSGTRADLYFYSKHSAFGEQNAGYYDFITDGPTWADGKIGKAVQSDGFNDYTQILDSQSLDIAGSLTVEAWIKPNSLIVSPRLLRRPTHTDWPRAAIN